MGILEWPKDGLTIDDMPHKDRAKGPITFHSREQLRRHCKEYGVESGALL